MQHGHVMPKGNGFYELGIQPSLNAIFFSLKDPKAEGTTCSKKKVKTFFFRYIIPQKPSLKYLKPRKSIKMLNKCCQNRVQQRKKKSQIAVLQQFGIDFVRCLAELKFSTRMNSTFRLNYIK